MFKRPVYKPTTDELSLLEQREDILKNFDFKTLARIMALPCRPIYDDDDIIVGYEPWRIFTKNGFIIPDEIELRKSAEKLLDRVVSQSFDGDKVIYVACGPFKAIFRYGILELDAVLTSWSWD